ncbi:MAG: Hsp20/alpha crystallin family protein [Spirochaetota bacterium]|nr:MAG: Hsp20/alpha crystallin family protein [Spirochaetota bacterium]
MDNLFESFFGRERAGRWCVDVDVTETPEEIQVKADVPGIDKKDISITLSGDNLMIKGERKEEKEEKTKHSHRIERRCGSFQRILPVPVAVDSSKISAEYKDGVLTVHLPKKAEAKPKEIPIKVQ